MTQEQANAVRALFVTAGAWYLPHTAKAFETRGALAGLWISMKNSTRVSASAYRRCWPFHVAMKPFYHLGPQRWTQQLFYVFFPIWRWWLQRQPWPECNLVHAIMGFATEPFGRARPTTLKVVDAQNSHPTSYYGYWQRELDLWCPGETATIPRWMFSRMNRELKAADLVLCPSTFVRDTMVTNGVPGEKCFVSPFGVDTSIFVPRKELPHPPQFICVGTICLRKGHQYLFRAFEIVKRSIPDAQLICVGLYSMDFRRERSQWAGSFRHYESLPHAQLAPLLAQCTAFVFPSVEEGFARVLTEAMAAGLPIIASHESGATTLVEDGKEGLLVRPQDPEQIAQAMIRLARDPDFNRTLGQAAWRKGAVGNSWQDYGDRLLTEYTRRLALRSMRRFSV